jgi:predicted nucleotidyltransferase
LVQDHIEEEHGETVFRHACKLCFEGIVSKRLGVALYLWPLARMAQVQKPSGARREARGRGGLGKRALAMSAMPQVRNEQMNRKQKVALQIIAAWADRFACVKTAVIFGSVARGDEKPGSDLDLDLQYVDDLTGRMVVSYTKAHRSFDKLRERILCATGHRLKLCNYMPSRYDHVVRDAIKHGIEVATLRKVRIVATKPK